MLDLKIKGITREIMEQALSQAREGRIQAATTGAPADHPVIAVDGPAVDGPSGGRGGDRGGRPPRDRGGRSGSDS